MHPILILAAHPDDEVLGCGGTIAKLSEEGFILHVAFLADGLSSRAGEPKAQQLGLTARRAAAQKACNILGVELVSFGDFPDNRMDIIPLLDITQTVEVLIAKHQPEIVYTHHSGDVNIDHRRLHEAVVTACRPTPGHCVKRLLSFEVASSTEWQPPGSAPVFQPNWFVDISAQWERKRLALEAYACEMRPWPHARSIQALEHLARWRGAQVGVEAAEAFCLMRQLV